MVPTGQTRNLHNHTARPVHMGSKEPISAPTPRLECQSHDQTRHRPDHFRAFRSPQGEGAGSGSDHIRRTHKCTGQRGQGRTSEFWSISNQAKRWSGCQKSSNGRRRQRPTKVFREFQARQRNGSQGEEPRQATVSLKLPAYREMVLVAVPRAYACLFQQYTTMFEKFYHRTEKACTVHRTQSEILEKASLYPRGGSWDVPALSAIENENITFSTETNDITDTGSAAR